MYEYIADKLKTLRAFSAISKNDILRNLKTGQLRILPTIRNMPKLLKI